MITAAIEIADLKNMINNIKQIVFNKRNKMPAWHFCGLIVFFASFCCYANINATNHDIQNLLNNFRINSNVPAAVLSINSQDNKLSNFVSGTLMQRTATDKNPSPIATDNLFQIGSITKSFTAAVVLQLEAEGKLSINDTISDITQKYGQWLPKKEYDAWKNISIKQLLNMTSGIYSVTEDKDFMSMLAKQPLKNWTPQEIIKYAYKNKSYFFPGKGWHYSDTNYNILEILIETVTKHSFKDEINQRILKKYGLNNTYYLPCEYPINIMDRMAHGYAYTGGGFSPPIASGSDMTRFNMSAAGASGALVSNSIDITRWVKLIFTGNILPAAQLNEMMSAVCTGEDKSCNPGEPLSSDSHSQGYSLGLARIYDPQLGVVWVYIGGTPGYFSSLMWLPKKNIALALTVSATTKESKKLLKLLGESAKLILK